MRASTKESITTVSEHIAFSFQRVLLKLGIISSVSKTERPKTCIIEGRICNQRNTYQIGWYTSKTKQYLSFIENGYAWIKVKSNSKTFVSDEPVFNFEVAEDNSYVVKNVCVHNCQAFSSAGKRQGLDDPRGTLFVDFARLIVECNPLMFVVENVHGLLTINKGETIKQILDMLNVGNAYNIKYQILMATDYEVPQKRKRVIIVGTKKHLPEYEFPAVVANKVVLRDVLTNCPPSPGMVYTEEKRKVMELVPQGGCWVDLPEDIKIQYMGNSINSGGGKRGIARRLALDEACLTLTTSPCQKQTERCHPTETRPLNIREYARIQTFPDTYQFVGSIASKYRQIGNAVPVKLAYHIGMSIKRFLENNI